MIVFPIIGADIIPIHWGPFSVIWFIEVLKMLLLYANQIMIPLKGFFKGSTSDRNVLSSFGQFGVL